MRLAWQAGRPDVDAMVAELSPGQMAEWQAFIELFGLGPEMDDWRFARLGMILSQGRVAAGDLVHKPFWELARRKSAEQVIVQWEAFNARRKRK
jgi:hypothetical protein